MGTTLGETISALSEIDSSLTRISSIVCTVVNAALTAVQAQDSPQFDASSVNSGLMYSPSALRILLYVPFITTNLLATVVIIYKAWYVFFVEDTHWCIDWFNLTYIGYIAKRSVDLPQIEQPHSYFPTGWLAFSPYSLELELYTWFYLYASIPFSCWSPCGRWLSRLSASQFVIQVWRFPAYQMERLPVGQCMGCGHEWGICMYHLTTDLSLDFSLCWLAGHVRHNDSAFIQPLP